MVSSPSLLALPWSVTPGGRSAALSDVPSSAPVRSSIPTAANLRQHPAKLNEKRGINIDVTYKPPKSCSATARPNFEAGFCPTLCFSVTSSRSFMAHRHDHLYPPDPPLAQTILAATRRMHPLSATLFSIFPNPHPVLSFISRFLHIMDETPLLINETLFLTDELQFSWMLNLFSSIKSWMQICPSIAYWKKREDFQILILVNNSRHGFHFLITLWEPFCILILLGVHCTNCVNKL